MRGVLRFVLWRLNNPDYTILIAIRDEGVSELTDEMMEELQDLGVQTMLTETTVTDQGSTWPAYYRDSYYAVLNPGSAAVEAVSATDVLEYTGTMPDGRASYTIRSAGTNSGAGSYASIVVNDVEYAMNRRGMNLVCVGGDCSGLALGTSHARVCIQHPACYNMG